MKNYDVKLENERSSSVKKRLNRLSTWQFFRVLNRDDMLKIMLTNFLMLVFLVPVVLVYYYYQSNLFAQTGNLPTYNALGMGISVWLNVTEYTTGATQVLSNQALLLLAPAIALTAFAVCGGFAIIRNAFWTGKMVVFKNFFGGIGSGILYAIPCMTIIGFGFYGINLLQSLLLATIPMWVAIIILVLCYAALLFLAVFFFVLISVALTYKQSFSANISDAWQLLIMNIFPNIIHFVLAMAPVVLILLVGSNFGSFFATLIIMVAVLYGMFYIAIVWMTHMMKTFALFHPVETKKKS